MPAANYGEMVDYISKAAIARGIDPEVALRVAKAEALNVFDPSQADRGGDDGSSFGPFQLHYKGLSRLMPNAGLGDEFTRVTGLDARDPNTWKEQVDFSLDWAKRAGWKPWMGAKRVGVGDFQGITTQNATAASGAARHPPNPQVGTPTPPTLLPIPGDLPPAADVALDPYAAKLAADLDPYSSLAGTLAKSIGGGSGGGTGVSSLSSGGGVVIAPRADFAKATPEPVPMAPVGEFVAKTPQLADLFKVPEVGAAETLNLDPSTGLPLRRRMYG